MKTKRNIIIVVSLLVIWMITSLLLPPELKAESKENGFKVNYTVDNSLKRTWVGEVEMDKRQGEILDARFIENGKVISNLNKENPIDMMKNSRFEFAYLGGEPRKSIAYQLYIQWEEGGKEFEETLELQPSKRLFVIPKFR